MICDDPHYMSYADSHNKVYSDDDKLQWEHDDGNTLVRNRQDTHNCDNHDGSHIRNHRS